MFYYIKARKKGTAKWNAVRKDKRIVVFSNYEAAKGQITSSKDVAYKIVSVEHHPSNRKSAIYGKKYKITE